jgi:hypothetical protein
LLRDCWWHCAESAFNSENEIASDEIMDNKNVENEITRLKRVRDEWLNTSADDVLEGQTPAAVIDSERRRVPLAVSGPDAAVDCDCPLCQMMAECGPVFLHLDGCHMEDDYAFSFHKTQAQWKSEQVEWESVARLWEQELGVTESAQATGTSPDESTGGESLANPSG